ncbi:MAG TPA: HIT domain-containing protein [Candidatus Saccharimonadales bacterium]
MEDSIFTKIIKHELPCHKVYEDDLTIAIIPLYPIAVGHVLVIPKVQIDQFYDLEPKDYSALMETVKKIGKRMNQVLKTKRIGLQVIGDEVPHCHVHVIAFNTIDEYKQMADESLPVDHQKLAALASLLAF